MTFKIKCHTMGSNIYIFRLTPSNPIWVWGTKTPAMSRRQVVPAEGAMSAERTVNHGVPQGSVLGSPLFLVLVNDLGDDRVSLLFADDTTIMSRERTAQHAMEVVASDFRDAKRWFTANNFLLK